MQSQDGFYAELSQKCGSSLSMTQIEKDVHRTFPQHTYFQSEFGSQALYRVLIAYSNYNPQVFGRGKKGGGGKRESEGRWRGWERKLCWNLF